MKFLWYEVTWVQSDLYEVTDILCHVCVLAELQIEYKAVLRQTTADSDSDH